MAREVMLQESIGDAEPQSPEQQFLENLGRWLGRWLDHADEQECKKMRPALFVFAGDTSPESLDTALEEAHSFRNLFDQALGGYVHVCSLEMKKVWRRKVGFTDGASTLTWLSKSPASDCVAIVFVPKQRMALIRRAGMDLNECERIEFGKVPAKAFDFSQVDALLDRFHKDWTKTKDGNCRIWQHAGNRKLNQHPEQQIQGCLKGYFELTVRPLGAYVQEEFKTRMGRGDVQLVRFRAGQPPETCVMELKVLFPDKTQIWNRNWALSGIKQVLDYRESEGEPGPSYLCCFDARKQDADIPEVVAAAGKAAVTHKRYFMQTPGCPA